MYIIILQFCIVIIHPAVNHPCHRMVEFLTVYKPHQILFVPLKATSPNGTHQFVNDPPFIERVWVVIFWLPRQQYDSSLRSYVNSEYAQFITYQQAACSTCT